MSKLNNRLEKLEIQTKAHAKLPVWIDLFDNRVRLDISGNRGEEMTFDNVYDCVTWVEKQIDRFENFRGIACFSDISELFTEGMPRDLFNQIHEDTPMKSVVINLKNLNNFDKSIRSAAFITWLHFLPADEMKKTILRADALSQSLDDTSSEIEDEEEKPTE